MLRKSDGLTPLKHRGISVFAATYRMIGCAWWHRVMPQLLTWIHPAAAGGLPGRECLESAFDAQMAIERATLDGRKIAAVLFDYENIFDTFDIQFFTRLFRELGLPEPIAVLFNAMYSNIRRRPKINGHLDDPMDSNCGSGQGDSFSCWVPWLSLHWSSVCWTIGGLG